MSRNSLNIKNFKQSIRDRIQNNIKNHQLNLNNLILVSVVVLDVKDVYQRFIMSNQNNMKKIQWSGQLNKKTNEYIRYYNMLYDELSQSMIQLMSFQHKYIAQICNFQNNLQMRRRFGAIHSETAEEFIELAQSAWDKDLFFYEGSSNKSQKLINFEYDERDTNSTDIEEEYTIETQNVKIMIIDTDQSASQIFNFCGEKQYSKKNFDYVSKVENNGNKQVTYHFWINNDAKNSKFNDIMDVYLKTCDVFIYIGNKSNDYHNFLEKIKKLNKKQFKVYKVQNLHRTQSFKSLSNAQITTQVKSLQEALQRTINQYI